MEIILILTRVLCVGRSGAFGCFREGHALPSPRSPNRLREKLPCTNYARGEKRSAMFQSFVSKFVPKVKAEEDAQEEEELVDPQQSLRDKCREGHHAKSLAEKYQACNDRVNSRSQTTETCVEELFDLLHAIDHCVTEKLFSHLK